jgi:hypothetical protein
MKHTKILLIITSISLLCACTDNKSKLTSFAEPQEYAGEVVFENSKNVVVHFILSADATQITELKMTADTLSLPIKADSKKNEAQAEEVIFKYSDDASIRVNYSTTETNAEGNKVIKVDENGNPLPSNVVFRGGFESTSPIKLINNKISLNAFPLIADLTVTNTEISGKIKVELKGFITESVSAVFENITQK